MWLIYIFKNDLQNLNGTKLGRLPKTDPIFVNGYKTGLVFFAIAIRNVRNDLFEKPHLVAFFRLASSSSNSPLVYVYTTHGQLIRYDGLGGDNDDVRLDFNGYTISWDDATALTVGRCSRTT